MKLESKSDKCITDVTDVTDDSTELIPITDFPFDIFPDRFQEIIQKTGIVLSIEPEVVAHAKIAILSGVIGNSIRISPKTGYNGPPFVWAGLIASTGYGKSPAINESMDYIETLQAKSYKEYQDEIRKYNNHKKSQANNPGKSFPSTPIPVFKQLKVSDTTVEALADVFTTQPRGVILHRDELSGFILSMNQYKDAKGSDKQHYLELFDAKPMTINRKMSAPKYVHNTGAAIIGGISPMILPKIFNTDSFHDGFLPRFLFLNVENKHIKYCRESLDADDKAYWESLIDYCYKIPLSIDNNNCVKPKILTLEDNALDSWESFNNEYKQVAFFLPERIRGFIPKLITYSLKFAGILHVIQNCEKKALSTTIDAETINRAIKLTRFYAGQAVLIVKMYDSPELKFNASQKRIIQVLNDLQSEVGGGELLLSEIVKAYNDSLNDSLKLSPEKIRKILKNELDLTTRKGAGNLSCLIWEQEKLEKLFKQTVTTVTTVTTVKDSKENNNI